MTQKEIKETNEKLKELKKDFNNLDDNIIHNFSLKFTENNILIYYNNSLVDVVFSKYGLVTSIINFLAFYNEIKKGIINNETL